MIINYKDYRRKMIADMSRNYTVKQLEIIRKLDEWAQMEIMLMW